MRICISTSWFPPSADLPNIRALMNYLRSQGHSIQVVTTNEEEGDIDSKFSVYRFERSRTHYQFNDPRPSYRKLVDLAEWSDVVMSLGVTRLSALTGIASRKTDTPLVLRPSGWAMDDVDITLKGTLPKDVMKHSYKRIVRRISFKNADRVICICEAFYQICSRYTNESKLELVPNGTDVSLFSPTAKGELPETIREIEAENVILSVNSVRKLRGIQYVVDALPAILEGHPDTHFLIAGTGPYIEEIKKRARDRGVSAYVHYIGALTERQAVINHLHHADVAVVMSSADAENYFAQEALATECPLVVSSAGGLIDLVGENERGRVAEIFPPKSYNRNPPYRIAPDKIELISNNINWILSHPDEAGKLAQKGREFMVNERSREKELTDTERVLLAAVE